MSKQYDAIVIGAGLSGITCAGYLAKAGKNVLVLEKLPQIGGCTIPNRMQGMTISMVYPISAQYTYGNACGWAKAAQDFGANVRMMNSAAPRVYIKGMNASDQKIPICLAPEGAARWMADLLKTARPDLFTDKTEAILIPIMKEIYEASLETLTVEWGETSVGAWISARTDDKGVHFVFNMMMSSCIFTCDADYTWNYGSAGKGLVLLRIWLAGDGTMSVPYPNPQEGIALPLAEAVQSSLGVEIRTGMDVKQVIVENGTAKGVKVALEDGIVQELYAQDVVVSTRWGCLPDLFDPLPDFLQKIIAQINAPAHMMGSTFAIYVLNDTVALDGSYFMEFDPETGSHILGGTAQSTEQPWNTIPGKQFIWAFRIHKESDFEKLGREQGVAAQMKKDMEKLFPGFADALVFEAPASGRLAPSHYFYNNQEKIQHSYPEIKHLYFAGDCTKPMHSMLTDGAASTGFLTAQEILGVE